MKYILVVLSLFQLNLTSAQNFPDNWIGEYSGDMILGHYAKPNDTIPVDFEIKELIADSAWTYKMSFHSEKHGEIVKNYVFRTLIKGEFVNFLLDELNGIVMELSLMNDCFYGTYDVLDSKFVSTMRYTESKLFFELFSSSLKDPKISSTNNEDTNNNISVTSYKPILHQTVILTKK